MSQEEEKLIEEFIQNIRAAYNTAIQLPGKVLAFEDFLLPYLRDGIHEAYRAGKLAEIIAFEKLIPEKRKKYFSERNGYMKETFSDGYNEVVDEIKSLIEEEKKKI